MVARETNFATGSLSRIMPRAHLLRDVFAPRGACVDAAGYWPPGPFTGNCAVTFSPPAKVNVTGTLSPMLIFGFMHIR